MVRFDTQEQYRFVLVKISESKRIKKNNFKDQSIFSSLFVVSKEANRLHEEKEIYHFTLNIKTIYKNKIINQLNPFSNWMTVSSLYTECCNTDCG